MTDAVNRRAYQNNKTLASARTDSTLTHALFLLFRTRKIWLMPCTFLRPDIALPAQGILAKSMSLQAWGSGTAGLPRKGQRKETENKMEERADVFSYAPNQKVRCMPTETSASLLCFSRYLVQFQKPWSSKPGARLIRVELSPSPHILSKTTLKRIKDQCC